MGFASVFISSWALAGKSKPNLNPYATMYVMNCIIKKIIIIKL